MDVRNTDNARTVPTTGTSETMLLPLARYLHITHRLYKPKLFASHYWRFGSSPTANSVYRREQEERASDIV
jgi:hypothetical protein